MRKVDHRSSHVLIYRNDFDGRNSLKDINPEIKLAEAEINLDMSKKTIALRFTITSQAVCKKLARMTF